MTRDFGFAGAVELGAGVVAESDMALSGTGNEKPRRPLAGRVCHPEGKKNVLARLWRTNTPYASL